MQCLEAVCERLQWVGGAAGRCNSTGVCICPPGFSGSYILSMENDCHMSRAFKETLNSATFGSSLCLLVGALAALLKVVVQLTDATSYRIVPRGQHFETSNVQADKRGLPKILRKRKLLAVCDILLFVLFAACEVYRTSILLAETEPFATQVPSHVILVYALGICSSTCSILLFMYIYTTSLPKGRQLGAVLGISYDFSRYQKRRCFWLHFSRRQQ